MIFKHFVFRHCPHIPSPPTSSPPTSSPLGGDAATVSDQIPWLLKSDLDTVCLVTGTGAQVSKRLMTVADVLCEVTRTRGVTEVTVIDHDLSPMLKEHPGPGEHFGWKNVLQTCAHYMRSDEHAWMVTIVKFMIVEG